MSTCFWPLHVDNVLGAMQRRETIVAAVIGLRQVGSVFAVVPPQK
jgi:hypothetical protein